MKLSQWSSKNRRLPPLEALRVLEVVVSCGGFSKAAVVLNLTPNAVAHQIRKLEEWYGFSLFQRHSRGVTATSEVKQFVIDVRRAFDDLRVASEHFCYQKISSAVTISAMPSLVTKWLLPRLGELRIEQPEIKFRVVATPVIADLEREDVDIVIREGMGSWSDVISEEIFSQWWSPVCSPSYVERHQLKQPEDLSRVDILHDAPWDGTPLQIMWSDWCQQYNLTENIGREHLQFSHSYLSLEAAMAGQGIALGNLALVAEDLKLGRLIAPFGRWITGPYSFHIGRSMNVSENSAVVDIYRWLVQDASKHLDVMKSSIAGSNPTL